ncbi:hypothetical protein [Bacillus spizizenii]|uniref:Uncharacterized protein n=1 Tax=Bacillus spizizenii (strain DSM 15029 / JCM 12233 / NBRC 101239 / NRRL B-23049 / TU-B-10) TaxID=1052585 RepID=G4NXT3_BACS4|nr:hypothetical protein [Bacillus spizizenii]AEP87523.1 hypothetical protein GYO_2916 [Bacillus spizizenii TU-B-10]SCV42755.1 hypothetical protein BQ1740_3182 [Bacillus subtilis]
MVITWGSLFNKNSFQAGAYCRQLVLCLSELVMIDDGEQADGPPGKIHSQ